MINKCIRSPVMKKKKKIVKTLKITVMVKNNNYF